MVPIPMDNLWVIITGWWLNPTPLKILYSQLELLFPIYGKITTVPVTTNQDLLNSLNCYNLDQTFSGWWFFALPL